jgi:hypothetical protein
VLYSSLDGSAVWLWAGKKLVWAPIFMLWSWDKPNIEISPRSKGGLRAMSELHILTQRSTVQGKSHLHSPCRVREDLHVASRPKKTIPFPSPVQSNPAQSVQVVFVGAVLIHTTYYLWLTSRLISHYYRSIVRPGEGFLNPEPLTFFIFIIVFLTLVYCLSTCTLTLAQSAC